MVMVLIDMQHTEPVFEYPINIKMSNMIFEKWYKMLGGAKLYTNHLSEWF